MLEDATHQIIGALKLFDNILEPLPGTERARELVQRCIDLEIEGKVARDALFEAMKQLDIPDAPMKGGDGHDIGPKRPRFLKNEVV